MSRSSFFNQAIERLRSFFGGGKEQEQSRLEEEIQSIIDEGEQKGLIDEKSGEMIQSILEFRDTVAREVMIPRTEIVAIPSDAPVAEIVGQVTLHGYTRMPVYDGSVDNIIGILNVKDLLRLCLKPIDEADLKPLLRKPYFIPETKNTHLLLHELKGERQHMAIVIDEYGGTAAWPGGSHRGNRWRDRGEHDTDEADFTELSDGYVLADSRVEIERIEEHFGVTLPEGKYETLAGFILHLIRKIPHRRRDLSRRPGNGHCLANERSIRKVKIRKPGEAAPLKL